MHEMIYTEMFFQMRVGDTKKKVPLLSSSSAKTTKGTKTHLDIRLEKPINLTTYSLLGLQFLLHHSTRVTNYVFLRWKYPEYLFYYDR